MAFIIAADEIKKTLPGYDPAKSEEFHHESARIADIEFKKALKIQAEGTVILMSGGAASGKSEYVSVYLEPKECIVFDGTLPTPAGAEVKIRNILRAKKNVEIHAIWPEDFTIAYIAFLNRDRKFSDEHFFRTHSQSRKTLLHIAKKFPSITINLTLTEYNEADSMTIRFTRIAFHSRERMIEFLEVSQYTEDDIRNKVIENHAT